MPEGPIGAGQVVTEGLQEMNLAEYQRAGYRGQGVRIAVVDQGFIGFSKFRGSDIPQSAVAVVCNDVDGATRCERAADDAQLEVVYSHGTACAEIVHDLAPQAELYLIRVDNVTQLDGVVGFLEANNIRLASVSLGDFPYGPSNGRTALAFDSQEDPIQRAARNNILFVASAGNWRTSIYEGEFTDTNGDGLHEFGSWLGQPDSTLSLRLERNMTASIYLDWDEWNWTSPRDSEASSTYAFTLTERSPLSTFIATGAAPSGLANAPVREVTVVVGSNAVWADTLSYELRVRRVSGTGRKFRVIVRRGLIDEYNTYSSSLAYPASSPFALSVGAVSIGNFAGWGRDEADPQSSMGPLWNDDRTTRISPDVSSYANVSTRAHSGFPGTSAAAPHVAGAAAVLLSVNPNLSAADLKEMLQASVKAKKDDNRYGAGIVRLPLLAQPTVKLVRPNAQRPAIIGDLANPGRLLLEVDVRGQNNLFLGSLSREDFTVWIGGHDAPVVNVVQLAGSYLLEVRSPTQSAAGAYALEVRARMGQFSGTVTEEAAVAYTAGGQQQRDVVLVIDRSYSMQGQPLASAQTAAQLFVDQMRVGDRLAVVSFYGDAVLDQPLTTIDDQSRAAIKGVIGRSWLGSATSIGDGLSVAFNELRSSPRANSANPWAIVLLSDGGENTPAYVADVMPQIVQSKTVIHTIGLGATNESLLKDIAEKTSGVYRYTPDASGLNEIYNQIAGRVAARQTLFEQTQDVSGSAVVRNTVQIDASVEEAIFTATWPSPTAPLRLELVSPSGLRYAPGEPAGRSPTVSATSMIYTIPMPEDGAWTTLLSRPGGAPALAQSSGASRGTVSVQGSTLRTFRLYTDLPEYQAGARVRLQAVLTEGSSFRHANALVWITRPDGRVALVPLEDRAGQGDLAAGDGVFSTSFPATAQQGTYQVTAHIYARSPIGEAVERSATTSFVIVPPTDRDSDGLGDGWEEMAGTDSLHGDQTLDYDGDGLTNFQEYQVGSAPRSVDTDEDGLGDAQEIALNTFPFSSDSDGDGTGDGAEVAAGKNPADPADATSASRFPPSGLYLPLASKPPAPLASDPGEPTAVPPPTATATHTATPSATATATATATSTPSPTATATPQVAPPQFTTIDIAPIANWPLDYLVSPPTGAQTFGGVPFVIRGGNTSVFQTRHVGLPQLPLEGSLATNVARPFALHLLLNGGYVDSTLAGQRIGEVILRFSNGEEFSAPIIAGQMIREPWSFADTVSPEALVPGTPGVFWANVYQEAQLRDGRPALGFIDRVTILVPPTYIEQRLTSIVLRDSSASAVGTENPSLIVAGVTVESYPGSVSGEAIARTAEIPIKLDSQDGYEDPIFRPSGDGLHNDWIGTGTEVMGGWIFPEIPIPRGARILRAYVRFRGFGNDGYATARLYAFAQDNPAPFVEDGANRPSTRPRSAASVDWTSYMAFRWQWITTPDLSALVQEVVDRSGWSAGNAFGVQIGNPSGNGTNWSFVDFAGGPYVEQNGGPGHSVTLYVTYIVP